MKAAITLLLATALIGTDGQASPHGAAELTRRRAPRGGLEEDAPVRPPARLEGWTLEDQRGRSRTIAFPRDRLLLVTVCDQRGSKDLEPWVKTVFTRFQDRLDIEGVADVSNVPVALRGLVRQAFKRQPHSIMLDWEGRVVTRFAYEKNVPNLYLIDGKGRVQGRWTGVMTAEQSLLIQQKIEALLQPP